MDYAALQTAVSGFLDSSEASTTAIIPTAVALAEAQMNRRLRVNAMVGRDVAVATGEYVTLPADCLQPILITLDDGTELVWASPSTIAGRAPASGNPVECAVVGTSIRLFPTPGSINLNLTYYQSIPALSDTTTSNWLLASHPDAYVYGTLVQMGTFLISENLSTWAALYKAAVDDIASSDRKNSFGGRLEPRPSLHSSFSRH